MTYSEIVFNDWMGEVNMYLRQLAGVEADDLPDFDYWDYFANGEHAYEVALETLVVAGYDLPDNNDDDFDYEAELPF